MTTITNGQWVMSRLVARSACLLANIVAYTTGFVALAILGLALRSALPSAWLIPIVATGLWPAAFAGLAVWRFGREQL